MKKITCPGCGWSTRVVYLSSRDSYQCMHCGQIWERAPKLIKEKSYRCPSCDHEWKEEDILTRETIQVEEQQGD